jgi:hypothetical protein
MSILKKLKNKLKKNYYRMFYQRSAKKQIESLDISVLKALRTKASKYLDENDEFLKEINHRILLTISDKNLKFSDEWLTSQIISQIMKESGLHTTSISNYYVERSSNSSSGATDPAQCSGNF